MLRKFKNNLPLARKNAKIADIHSVLIIRRMSKDIPLASMVSAAIGYLMAGRIGSNRKATGLLSHDR